MDLALRTPYRLHEFFTGGESPVTLLNFVVWFERMGTSCLSWAQANDVERYREAQKQRAETGDKAPVRRKPSIETFEWSREVELLAGMFEQMQQLIHASYTHGSKAAKKKPKISRYPRPTTAAQKVKKAAAREQLQRMEQVITFSDEPYGEDSQYVRHSRLPATAGTGTPKQSQAPPRRGLRKPGHDEAT